MSLRHFEICTSELHQNWCYKGEGEGVSNLYGTAARPERAAPVSDSLKAALSHLLSTDPRSRFGGRGGDSQFHETWRPRANPWLIAITVTMATFMEALDTSIANVAMPHIGGSLSASRDEATWVLTSYLVANAVVLPISGWIANRIGRKRFYMSCVALFTLTSLMCGLAPSSGPAGFFAYCRAQRAADCSPASSRSWLIRFHLKSAAWPLRSTEWP